MKRRSLLKTLLGAAMALPLAAEAVFSFEKPDAAQTPQDTMMGFDPAFGEAGWSYVCHMNTSTGEQRLLKYDHTLNEYQKL